MELKKDEKPTAGLKLAGVNEEELKKKTGISEMDAWDFSDEQDPYYVTSAKSKLNREAKENKEISAGDIILKTFQVIMWLAIAAESGAFMYIGMQENHLVLQNLSDMSWIFKVCGIILVLDAILVNVITDKNIMLVVVALVLPFLYPALRSAHVSKKNGIGVVISFLYFLSIVFMFGFYWNAHMFYGDILSMEDKAQQQIVVQAYNQPMENGKTLGEILKNDFDVENITLETGKIGYVLTIQGNGNIYMKDDGFVNSLGNKNPSTLVFSLSAKGGLTLTAAALNGVELSETGVINYWEMLTK